MEQLKSLGNNHEVIVTDGGSKDNTIGIAKSFNTKVCIGEKGRGKQLLDGASCSNGDVLIYLHADTLLPDDAFEQIDKLFTNDEVKIASFRMRFDDNHPVLKLYSYFTRFDSFFTNFGDQVIVIKKDFYNELNGFEAIKIFEDVDLLRRARKRTKVYKIPAYVITSARRFLKVGVFKMQLKNFFYLMNFLAGSDKDKIYNKYFGNK